MYGHKVSEAIQEADVDGNAGGHPYMLFGLWRHLYLTTFVVKTLHKLDGLMIDGRQGESGTVRKYSNRITRTKTEVHTGNATRTWG